MKRELPKLSSPSLGRAGDQRKGEGRSGDSCPTCSAISAIHVANPGSVQHILHLEFSTFGLLVTIRYRGMDERKIFFFIDFF